MLFPDDNDEGDEEASIKPWGEVAEHQWLHVVSTRNIMTMYGLTRVLTLRDRVGNLFDTWTTKLINESIDCKMARGGTLFIKSLGLKNTKSGKKKYYDIKYKLMQ